MSRSSGTWNRKRCWNAVLAALMVAAALSIAPRDAQAFGEGARGPDVYAVQGMLKSLGFYAGPIDGIYGPLTKAGVRYFQQTYGLPATGNVDDQTLQAILWAYAEAKIPKKRETPQEPGKITVPGLSQEEQQMVDLVNAERAKAGLPALKVDLELARVARIKSRDMIENDYFSHTSPIYGSPFDMIRNFGISYRAAGENLACNQTVEAAHQSLMNSSGHRANILNSTYTHIGVGIVNGGMCGKMFTQMFIAK